MPSTEPGRATRAQAQTLSSTDSYRAASEPRLGVGIMYGPALPDFLGANLDAVDFVSIIPDMFWIDGGRDASPRYVEVESWIDVLDWVAARRPLVAHNLGFSLGSVGCFDSQYLEHVADLHRRFRFQWHSDHLSFALVAGTNGRDDHASLAVPLPCDQEVLDVVAEHIGNLRRRIPTPFLVENSVYYIVYPQQEMSEPEFLNRLARRTGCGLLLDVHNLYANARNHRFDPIIFLDELDLTSVVEVHIAGGLEMGGMYTDSHSGAPPEPVWTLLEEVVPRAPNLRGVTFELHDSYFPLLGPDGVRAQLERARAIWTRSH